MWLTVGMETIRVRQRACGTRAAVTSVRLAQEVESSAPTPRDLSQKTGEEKANKGLTFLFDRYLRRHIS